MGKNLPEKFPLIFPSSQITTKASAEFKTIFEGGFFLSKTTPLPEPKGFSPEAFWLPGKMASALFTGRPQHRSDHTARQQAKNDGQAEQRGKMDNVCGI